MLIFNDAPRISIEQIYDDFTVVIIDDVFANPDQIAHFACTNAGQFVRSPHASYPGINLYLHEPECDSIRGFFRRRIRELANVSRAGLRVRANMSLAIDEPGSLSWAQRMCHTDDRAMDADHLAFACVTYLFRNRDLGGTGFYRTRPHVNYRNAVRNYMRANAEQKTFIAQEHPFFSAPPNYLCGSNEFVELVKVVPAAWNRMIFYRGDIEHSAHITHPELLDADPGKGRLTLNAFIQARKL